MGYMSKPMIPHYYKALIESRTEKNSSFLWWSILTYYFELHNGYGQKMSFKYCDGEWQPYVVVSRLESGAFSPVILLDFERENRFGFVPPVDDPWREVKARLEDCLDGMRIERGDQTTLYAIGTVGSHSRFYCLKPNANKLSSYPGLEEKTFEIKEDEEQIERIVLQLIRDSSREVTLFGIAGNKIARLIGSMRCHREG
ncbi:hypothetical protein LOZ66_005998 [Ophidiomyces ophidiicola]|nr:hypothetical protein LOZ65_004868 [Ophidiomyces ophidiicola]KAI1934289.1 hypothetical protein LOZ66_005998 [Ophidiomyces ophidiicola]